MPLMDEFREERKAIKNAPLKQKLKYFWGYYKVHTIAVICIVTFIIVFIAEASRNQQTHLFVAFLNSTQNSIEKADEFANEYAKFANLKLDRNNYCAFDSSMIIKKKPSNDAEVTSRQRMMVYTTTGEIDIIAAASDVFTEYANGQMFFDLRNYLTEEQIQKYSPYFYYVDQTVVEILNSDAAVFGDEDYVPPEIPDPTKPEDMDNPVPVGLYITDIAKINDTYTFYDGDDIAMGVVLNGKHRENTLKFIDYLYSE